MPRIPVRIEPYTSPSRQHRHYKNKRDQVLRALGKSAYINGSHFAIMWVSARGEVETYASEALQDRLEDWFDKSGLSEEAKKLVIGAQGNPRSNPFKNEEENEDEELSDDERGLSLHVPSQTNSLLTTPVTPGQDVFGGGRPQLQRSASTSASGFRGRKRLSPLNTNMANDDYLRLRDGNGELHPQSAIEGHYMGALNGLGLNGAGELDSILPPHSAPLRPSSASKPMARSSSSSNQQHVPQFETRLDNQTSRTAFLELRFSQLQQGMCKTVAKAWIKIIEPKKQTRCPYNKGEEGKPNWWPEGVRHKEPDHLMKPERHALLLTILRSPKVKVARLQLATAEVVALIKGDRVSLLMDVYRIAREEEKMREAGIDMDTPITVGVSTLDGWSESDQCVTAECTSALVEEEAEPSGKKRALAMSRSVSASSALKTNKKRRLSGMDPSSSPFTMKGGNLDVPNGAAARRASAGWMIQEGSLQQKANKRPSSSHSMAASAAAAAAMAAAGYGQSHGQQVGIDQNYGLMTPLTGNNTQLMDPSFLQPVDKQPGSDAMVAGYMSAPQPSHSQLFPDAGYQFQTGTPSQHHYNMHAASRDASNMFAYQQQQQQQQQQRDELAQQQANNNESPSQANAAAQSALGLQGIGMHWSQAGFSQDFSSSAHQASAGWWAQQQQQQQQKEASGADASFDTSFASTADSAGPATPPMASAGFQRVAGGEAAMKQQQQQQSLGAHDYMQQQAIHTQQQQQQQHAQQSQFGTQQRNPYSLSLGWSYQA